MALTDLMDSIVENIPHMIFVKDAKELRFVLFNKAGEELLGFPREQMIGKNDYDFFPKEEADFFTSKDRMVLNGRQLVNIPEEVIHTRLKGPRILHTKKIPIFDESGEPRYLLGISEDITEKKKSEESLHQKTTDLARSNAEREQLKLFAYVASHDLQEPLQKIIGFGDLLKMNSSRELNTKSREYLDRMQVSAFRMGRLIDDLLKLATVSIEKQELLEVDLNKVCEQVISDLEHRIEISGASVEAGSLPTVKADWVQMCQLFQNLISNALKFKRPAEKPHVRIYAERLESGWSRICVEDNGIGFDLKNTERIFKPFERLHGRDEYEGNGIGLAICQKIAERHGGRLGAESSPGKGSKFLIEMPVV